MIAFLICVLLLVVGYLVYGRISERVYGFNREQVMPCVRHPDGVDFVPLPMWKVFLVQLLNIAGLGPVVGAVSGALFGPAALLWIVLGCVFAGAMHDFLAACMSADKDGANLPDVVGSYMGRYARNAMSVICIFLLLMVGVVFTLLPAGMLSGLVGGLSKEGWSLLILGYYFLATILPINAIIGRIYPIFGALFLFMAVSIVVMLPLSGVEILPSLNFWQSAHPDGLGVWPMIFVTIACGAISGFHATQSPMMVRCLKSAGQMRRVFYGAMIVEGMVALVWATVGLTLREVLTDYTLVLDPETGKNVLAQVADHAGATALNFAQLTLASPAGAINEACRQLLGSTGAFIAVLGVVVLAVTSGDTAMRCCRLMLADLIRVKQVRVAKRLALAIPLFLAVIAISQLDYNVVWRYFGWANQALAGLTLWTITVCLRRHKRLWIISMIPALFMTVTCTTYLLYAPECGIRMDVQYATYCGLFVAAVTFICFLWRGRLYR